MGLQSGEEDSHKSGDQWWGMLLSSHTWVVLALCAGAYSC